MPLYESLFCLSHRSPSVYLPFKIEPQQFLSTNTTELLNLLGLENNLLPMFVHLIQLFISALTCCYCRLMVIFCVFTLLSVDFLVV